jgi:hypothetical protein
MRIGPKHVHLQRWMVQHLGGILRCCSGWRRILTPIVPRQQWMERPKTGIWKLSSGCMRTAAKAAQRGRWMDGAAQHDHLAVVKWLHRHRSEGCTTDAIDSAANDQDGETDIILWLHKHRSAGCTTAAMENAAAQYNFDAVLFLHSQRREGCTRDALRYTDDEASKNIYEWLEDHYSSLKVSAS